MEIISEFIKFLSGKKAYIVGILMVALGLLDGDNELALEGLGVITIRAGISKIQ